MTARFISGEVIKLFCKETLAEPFKLSEAESAPKVARKLEKQAPSLFKESKELKLNSEKLTSFSVSKH